MNELYRRLRRGLINLWLREVRGDHALKEAQRYKRDGGTRLLAQFPLGPDAVVLDIGGHVGNFAADIHSATGALVHIFEPVPQFYERCVRRFSGNPKIRCHRFGLGSSEGYFPISDANEASSLLVNLHDTSRLVEVRHAACALAELGIDRIDLIKMNIEGAEYDVLPVLLDAGIVARSRFLLIQFHTIGDFEIQRSRLRDRLSETHSEKWCYDFVWEAWEAKT